MAPKSYCDSGSQTSFSRPTFSSWHYCSSTQPLFEAATSDRVFIQAASDALSCCVSWLLLFLTWADSDWPDFWHLLIPAWPYLTDMTADDKNFLHTISLLCPKAMSSNVSMKKHEVQLRQMCSSHNSVYHQKIRIGWCWFCAVQSPLGSRGSINIVYVTVRMCCPL